MKIFITGGTGFVGSYLTRRFTDLGHTVTVITRSPRSDYRPAPFFARVIRIRPGPGRSGWLSMMSSSTLPEDPFFRCGRPK